MNLSRVISTLSFFAAFIIGIAVAYPFADRIETVVIDDPSPSVEVNVTSLSVIQPAEPVLLRAEDLRGEWRGEWGYSGERCSIEIARIDRDKFYGTLKKEGAEIAIEGTFDADEAGVFFRETRVIKLGPDMSEWSLGTNVGWFSSDGRTLSGTGIDKWGTYEWQASRY